MKNLRLYLSIILAISLNTVLAVKNIKVVILHTNDTHSQVEPTEKSTLKTSDMGGYARRLGVINKIRSEEQHVLLFDAGDFWQGTPYFNFFNGRIEIDALNRMKYDAVTLGNHEFDNGIDTLAALLHEANIPILSTNYNVENSPLKGLVQPFLVLQRFGLRIGVLTANVEPRGLIIENNYRGMVYYDPIATANKTAAYLKNKRKCDVIICLSHLGSDATAKAVNDFQLARESRYIDVIIGGHSHTLLENATESNSSGRKVVIAQMAKGGFYLGKIDIFLK